MSKNIRDLESIIDRDYYDTNVVRSTMVLIRKFLEEKSLKKDYPLLMLYCDWNVHTELDQRQECFNLLYSLTKVLVNLSLLEKWKEDGSGGLIWNWNNALVTEVNKSLGISELKKDIMKLFSSQELPTNLFENATKWKEFSTILIQILTEQTIKFPNQSKVSPKIWRQIEKIYLEIENISKGNKENQVIDFSLVPRDQIPEDLFRSAYKDIDIFFRMGTKSGIYFVGPFWITEITA